MAEEFVPITTQEEFDARIKERLQRDRDSYSKKFSDYDEIKSKNTQLQAQITEYTRQLEEANTKISGNDQIVADLNARIKSYETDSVKTRIALEIGLPYNLAGKISGENEEAMRADAAAMMKFIRPTAPEPKKSTETPAGDPKDEALKEMLKKIRKGE